MKDKVEREKQKLAEAGGFEAYIKSRKVKIDLIWFIVSVVGAFALGVVLF